MPTIGPERAPTTLRMTIYYASSSTFEHPQYSYEDGDMLYVASDEDKLAICCVKGRPRGCLLGGRRGCIFKINRAHH